jgi:hypothetical protein
MSFTKILITSATISILPFIPTVFGNEIREISPGKYALIDTDFGKTRFYVIYLGILPIIRNSLIFFSILILNFLLLKKFRMHFKKKKLLIVTNRSANFVLNTYQNQRIVQLQNSSGSDATLNHLNEARQGNKSKNRTFQSEQEKKLTLMILILSLVFILSRSLQMISTLTTQIDRFLNRPVSNSALILSLVASWLTFGSYSVNFFVYIIFNDSFYECFKNNFRNIKRFFKIW